MQWENLDPETPFEAQLGEDTGPVVVIDTFIVPEGLMDEVIKTFHADADFMKSRPGYISAQLHRGVGGSNLLMNVAVWESAQALARAYADPALYERVHRYPEGVRILPHVYRKIAVDGICVA